LLDNRCGNSNAAPRIAVLDIYLAVLGRERIGIVLGDREFVGHAWFKWLKDNGLNFVMRLPRHHQHPHRQDPTRLIHDREDRLAARRYADAQKYGGCGG